MAQQSPRYTGIGFALGSAALFGASTPMAKLLLGGISPWLMAGLLYLGAGLGLAAARLLSRWHGRPAAEASLNAADLGWLAAIVLFGGVAGPLLLMLGLVGTPAASAALLLNLEGLATLAIAWLVYRENVDLRIGIGAAAILLGAVILAWQTGAGQTGAGLAGYGALAIAGACLCWGIDNNLTRKLSSSDPEQIAMIKGLVAGLVNLLIGLLWQADAWPAPGPVLGALFVGFLGYGISLVLFIHALRHLGSARTGAYFSTAPFIGAIVAVTILGDALSVQLGLAGLLMAIGLYFHLAERHEHEHRHEAMLHDHAHVHDAHHQHAHEPGDPAGEPHVHVHRHVALVHRHPHYPDIHHRHGHGSEAAS